MILTYPNILRGLELHGNFITIDEMNSLISIIDEQPWSNDLKRRTQHYGYKYDYTKKKIDDSLYLGPLPDWLETYSKKLVIDGIFLDKPDQVIINEYLPGQGIFKHVDCKTCFTDTIASLSLLTPCIMDFENIKTSEKQSLILKVNSLLVLCGESRYDWMHSIKGVKTWILPDGQEVPMGRRISLTFRKILK